VTAPQTPAQHATVAAEPGSRLESLAEAYAVAKPAADEAKSRLDTIVDAIKLELSMAAPGATKVDFHTPALTAPLRLASRTSWRLDGTQLKAEQPELYVRYAKQISYWELRAVTNRS
jgi:hypothetical protein